ncbi:MAG: hypothetical protein QOE70_2619 [Chthoniobacter sp.]|jgi:hypothetical protein|nr:hypothetical protein [Chthoniobacter sp.]
MKRPGWLVLAPIFAALAACETTGDPRSGGLFGWSEAKAQDRQSARQAEVSRADHELAGETQRQARLRQRSSGTDGDLAQAIATQHFARERLRSQQDALVSKAEQLEEDSPTAATASRARSLRRKVNTVAANPGLSPAQRAARLRELEAEIDAQRAELSR